MKMSARNLGVLAGLMKSAGSTGLGRLGRVMTGLMKKTKRGTPEAVAAVKHLKPRLLRNMSRGTGIPQSLLARDAAIPSDAVERLKAKILQISTRLPSSGGHSFASSIFGGGGK